MSHLNAEELLDLAEGARAEAAFPHVASCAACRGQLSDLRAAMAAAEIDATKEGDVPEPSPLFWEHFSARVREAIAAEAAPPPRGSWASTWLSWKIAIPVAASIAVILAVAGIFWTPLAIRLKPDPTSLVSVVRPVPATVVNGAKPDPTNVVNGVTTAAAGDTASLVANDGIPETVLSSTDDPSWSLMADLAGDLDWDAAVEAGLTAPARSVDRALFDLSAEERGELQRLLKEELARSGA
jgi:hypothetical protein